MEFDGAFFSHVIMWGIGALTLCTGIAMVGACYALGRGRAYDS